MLPTIFHCIVYASLSLFFLLSLPMIFEGSLRATLGGLLLQFVLLVATSISLATLILPFTAYFLSLERALGNVTPHLLLSPIAVFGALLSYIALKHLRGPYPEASRGVLHSPALLARRQHIWRKSENVAILVIPVGALAANVTALLVAYFALPYAPNGHASALLGAVASSLGAFLQTALQLHLYERAYAS